MQKAIGKYMMGKYMMGKYMMGKYMLWLKHEVAL